MAPQTSQWRHSAGGSQETPKCHRNSRDLGKRDPSSTQDFSGCLLYQCLCTHYHLQDQEVLHPCQLFHWLLRHDWLLSFYFGHVHQHHIYNHPHLELWPTPVWHLVIFWHHMLQSLHPGTGPSLTPWNTVNSRQGAMWCHACHHLGHFHPHFHPIILVAAG